METVLRPDILQTYSGPCEQSNDMFYSENGEMLYNNQIFSRWGGESLVGPPEPYSMHDPEYDGLFYTDIQNYNGNIRNVDNLNLLNEEGCCTENRLINDAVKVGSEITDFSENDAIDICLNPNIVNDRMNNGYEQMNIVTQIQRINVVPEIIESNAY